MNENKIGIEMPHSSFAAMRVSSYERCNQNLQIRSGGNDLANDTNQSTELA